MSRIHEALQKAQQERAVLLQSELAAAPVESAKVETSGGDSAPAVAANFHLQTSVIAPSLGDSLRFEELTKQCAHPQWHPDASENVFLNSESGSHGAEQFRTLRSRLYQLRGTQPLQTLLITSSLPAEGKTFLANNLAQAFTRKQDCRVLLIDADLRRSRLHVPLGAPVAPGLTDYLRGVSGETSVIQHGQKGNLCLISGGNQVADPSELLSSGRLRILIERMKQVFDWIIVDSPPCLPVADSSGLADLCDGVLLVVRAGSTPAEVAQKTCKEMQTKNLIGVVLNAVEKKHSSSNYYGEYGYGHDKDNSR
jgi:capsular exopolysaccharide synthesis family protein